MCKFNQNLFTVFLLWGSILLIQTLDAAPVDYLLLDDLINDYEPNNGNDFDMTFDQRQNGTENVRLRIDGVLVAIPSSASSTAGSMAGNVAANYLLQLAAATEEDDAEDTDSVDNYFNFVKNSAGVTPTAGEKKIETVTKDVFKKKATSTPFKESEVTRVTIMKEENPGHFDYSKNAAAAEEEQTRPPVVPVKKVQSRRRNK